MSKKVIGGLLALVLVLSVFSFSVFAVSTGYEAASSTNKQTWGLENKQGSNGTYTVDVVLDTNYKVGPIQFKIIGDGITVTKVDVNETAYYPAEENHSSSGLVILTPDTSADLLGKELNKAVVATVTYTSSSNGTPAIEDEPKTASNPQGSLMAARLEGSNYVNKVTSLVVGQETKVYDLDEEWDEEEPPATEAADLQVKSSVTGVVIDTHKTFGGKYAGVVYGFTQAANNTFKNSAYITAALEATDGSALTITTSDGKADSGKVGNFGTGTTVKVGEKTYVICIFGDIDGNGLINTSDAQNTLAASTSGAFGNDTVITLAANVAIVKVAKPMHTIQTNDIQAIAAHVGGTKIDFAAVAKAHESFNTNYQ